VVGTKLESELCVVSELQIPSADYFKLYGSLNSILGVDESLINIFSSNFKQLPISHPHEPGKEYLFLRKDLVGSIYMIEGNNCIKYNLI
jgi:hypothetical protein